MKKFPKQLLAKGWKVFLFSSFCVYSWSIIVILYDFPSLLLRLTVEEIIGHISYQFTFALFESLILTCVVFCIGSILALKHPRKDPVVIGNLIVFWLVVSQFFYQFQIPLEEFLSKIFLNLPSILHLKIVLAIWLFLFFISPLLAYSSAKSARISGLMHNFTNRLPPLIGVYLFFSIMGLVVVVLRNI